MEHASTLVGAALASIATPEPQTITPSTTIQPRPFNWAFDTLGDPNLEKMLNATTAFAEAILVKESPRWLSLLGTSGAGKTHLSKKLLEFWRGVSGWRKVGGSAGTFYRLGDSRFVSWRKFIDRQKSGQFGEIQGIRETEFVIIDDIGAERDPSGFAKERLDDIADARLGKWTVFTSNLLLAQIAAIDKRIASRLIRCGSKVIEVSTTDYNLRASKQ